MSKTNALFPHIGGKNQLGEKLVGLLPDEIPDIYIEPYGGSFGLALQAKFDPETTLLIHNDLDNIIHAIINTISQYPEQTLDAVYDLLSKFDFEQSTVDYFRFLFNYKSITGESLFNDDIYLGAAAWILKNISRNGDCKNLRIINGVDEIDKLYTTFTKKEQTALELEGVISLSMDAIELLKKIRDSGKSHDYKIFLYIDAPYSHSGKRKTQHDLYRVDIDKDDSQIFELAKLIEEINQYTNCKIMVSEYDNPIYNSILTEEKGWHKITVDDVYVSVVFSSNGEPKPIETEYVWCNYKTP